MNGLYFRKNLKVFNLFSNQNYIKLCQIKIQNFKNFNLILE